MPVGGRCRATRWPEVVTGRYAPARCRNSLRSPVDAFSEVATEAAVANLTEESLRRWLTLLRQPDRLADAELEHLLAAHRRLPETRSALALGHAGAELLTDVIEGLDPPEESGAERRLPYLVLKTCFVEGAKRWQAANKLGISERQITRERSRAIKLLMQQLQSPALDAGPRYRPEPIPAILGFLHRPAMSRALREGLEQHRLVHVHGPPGAGKTSLVAEIAAEVGERNPTMWYRFRTGINDSMQALLFEIGEYLRTRRRPDLSAYIADALPDPDPALATRIALKGLAGSPLLLVLDDYHLVDDDPMIAGLVDEASARLLDLRVVTVGRHRNQGREQGIALTVPPFTRSETQELLGHLGIEATIHLADTIHSWTEGIPHLIKLAAAWLKTSDPDEMSGGVDSLADGDEVQEFLLDSITELMGPEDRTILGAASVFRDRFTDDALAFVARRTRGEVRDASLRLIRAYIATRGRDGDVAFFHNSVRDYVYDRLSLEERRTLHERAAIWCEDQGNKNQSAWHQERAQATTSRDLRV